MVYFLVLMQIKLPLIRINVVHVIFPPVKTASFHGFDLEQVYRSKTSVMLTIQFENQFTSNKFYNISPLKI